MNWRPRGTRSWNMWMRCRNVRAIEQAIHAHSKNSAIGIDGRVNVAHAKKKKRMDDDHEMLLLGVEKQRNALSETDARLQRLNDARERKEDTT